MDDMAALNCFLKTLESNYSLQNLTFIDWTYDEARLRVGRNFADYNLLCFYLKLNKSFRRKYLFAPDSNPSKDDLIDALALANQQNRDFEVIFYYLSEKIELILESNW